MYGLCITEGDAAMIQQVGKSLWESRSAKINHIHRINKGEHEKSRGQYVCRKWHYGNDTCDFLTKHISLTWNELKVHFRHYKKSLASFHGLTSVFLFYLFCYYRKQPLNQQRKLFIQEEARKDYTQRAVKCLQNTHWEYKQIPPNVFQQQGS